ncbi:MAG: helicase C-terminal domain-containing protein, partial [Patescibacteria group bacterium]
QKQESIIKALLPEENLIKWISSFANEVIFNSAPFNLGEYFRNCTTNFSQILMHDASVSADGSFKLIREIFELDSSWSAIKEDFKGEIEPTLSLKFYEKFPNPYSSGYFKKCVALFSEIIKIKKGKCLFLMSSKKTVEAMYSALLPYAQDCDSRLLGVGPSGGVGKSLALFLDKPDSSILLSTNQVLPFLHEFERHIETIVFQKIPFDPPDDPILSARGSQFDNGFEQYNLPRAIMRFREILNILGRGNSKKICHLLDSRLSNKDYGQLFTV